MITADQVLSELVQLQFFKFTPPEELSYAMDALKQNFTRWGIIDTDDGRRPIIERSNRALVGAVPRADRLIYDADAEDLFEKGVCDFLREIAPVLFQEGVQLQTLRDEARWDEQNQYIYYVWINGLQHQIFDGRQGETNAYCLALRRTAAIINRLLKSVGSSERAYSLSSGNNAGIAILTEPLYDYIRTLPLKPSALPMRAEEVQC